MPEALYRWEWQSGRLLRKQGDTGQRLRLIGVLCKRCSSSAMTYRPASATLPIGCLFASRKGHFFTNCRFVADAVQVRDEPKTGTGASLRRAILWRALKRLSLRTTFATSASTCNGSRPAWWKTWTRFSGDLPHSASGPHRGAGGANLRSDTFHCQCSRLAAYREVREFRRNLETRSTYGYRTQARNLYDWLIRPIRGLLDRRHITTVVFVSDGALRTIPLSALHDGTRFLIQDFAVAVVPGLSLVEPRHIERRMLISC